MKYNSAGLIRQLIKNVKLTEADEHYVVSLLKSESTSGVEKLEKFLELGLRNYRETFVNQLMIDALRDAGMVNTRMRFRGYAGGRYSSLLCSHSRFWIVKWPPLPVQTFFLTKE